MTNNAGKECISGGPADFPVAATIGGIVAGAVAMCVIYRCFKEDSQTARVAPVSLDAGRGGI